MKFPEGINNGQAACGGFGVGLFEPLIEEMCAGRNGSGRCPLTRAEILRTRGGNRLAGSALCVFVRLCKLACEIARPHRPGVASRSAPLLLFWQYRRKAPLGFSDQCPLVVEIFVKHPAAGGSFYCLSLPVCTRFAEEPKRFIRKKCVYENSRRDK